MKDRKDDFVVSDAITDFGQAFPLEDLLTLNYFLRYRDGYYLCPSHGSQIFVSVPQTAFPDLANLPHESSGTDRGRRFFHRADGHLPGSVRLRRASA